METLALILVAVTVALVIGIPLGIWAGRNPKVDRILRPLLDAAQTIPAYCYLILLVLFFSIGDTTALISTVIFALPPAVRLTSLGMRGVPSGAMEVADSFGTTSRQRLMKVQLPLAKPSIMLGVNQTIMMALGMVVIAAVVGAGGLGQEVLQGLRNLNVGEAFVGGTAIVIMAIVLDRVTYAWSKRDRRSNALTIGGRTIKRRWVVVAAIAAILIGVMVGREVVRQQDFPERYVVELGGNTSETGPVNAVVNNVTEFVTPVTEWISDTLVTYALVPLNDLLIGVPWWYLAGAVALLGFVVSRRWTLALFAFSCLAAIGIVGMWADAMDTLSQVIIAVVISVDHRDPARGVVGQERWVPACAQAHPGRDADDAGVRLPGAGGGAVQRGPCAGHHRRGDLRVAAVHPPHGSRDPAGAHEHHGGRAVLRGDLVADAAQGATAAGASVDPAGRSTRRS